jgi:hypothetical protein
MRHTERKIALSRSKVPYWWACWTTSVRPLTSANGANDANDANGGHWQA